MAKIGNQITFVERLGPNCAIGSDDYQWIVLKAHGAAREAHGNDWDGQRWDAVGFIASSKRALERCLEVKGLKVSAEGRVAVARQGERIWEWVRAGSCG